MKSINLITLLSLILAFTSCSTPRPVGKTEAEVLYREALRLKKDERYLLALERLNNLRSQYPYSFYATPAELMQADILFAQESYPEAAASYQLFRDFHPKNEKIDYVLWQLALSHFMQIPPTADRDLSSARTSIKFFSEFIRLYPDHEKKAEALEAIKSCRKLLQEKEAYIANYYFKTDRWISARRRYLSIIENFTEPKLTGLAMRRVVESEYEMKKKENCLESIKMYENSLEKSFADSMERKCSKIKTSKKENL